MMDESFGNITRALEAKGLLDNALLVFTTDVRHTFTPSYYGVVTPALRSSASLSSYCHTTEVFTSLISVFCQTVMSLSHH